MASEQLTSAGVRIGVVIADDHPVVRRGLRQLLESDDRFEVVAEAGDVESARRYVRGHHPAVLVLDLNMPGESSLDAIPKLREEFPGTQIVVLTMQDEPAYARAALSCRRARLRPEGSRGRGARRGCTCGGRGRAVPQPEARRKARGRATAGPSRWPHRARARDPQADRAWTYERSGRAGALPLRSNRRDPPFAHPAEARAARSRRDGSLRARQAAGLVAARLAPGPDANRDRQAPAPPRRRPVARDRARRGGGASAHPRRGSRGNRRRVRGAWAC